MRGFTHWLLGSTVLIALALTGCQSGSSKQDSATSWKRGYPKHWWAEQNVDPGKSWEILPHQAATGEVILSKRHELGLLSNFAATPFAFRGKTYASMEGFWQAMKFPEGEEDPRNKDKRVTWPWTRAQVEQMTAFEAKRAGDVASKNMKTMDINWVSFEGKRMTYRTSEKGDHYALILEATREKLRQNPPVKDALMATGHLRLRPDHHQGPNPPPAWRYYEIWEQLRSELRFNAEQTGEM
ncbi:MAG: NADAR family protein [Bdellovibrionaceae bacterium]|nr:NADAR family protein [Bdellovibrionales bacterium]MCB9085673.1 NADAR family protein [Pseudobdellovibrionaceae bacterium]